MKIFCHFYREGFRFSTCFLLQKDLSKRGATSMKIKIFLWELLCRTHSACEIKPFLSELPPMQVYTLPSRTENVSKKFSPLHKQQKFILNSRFFFSNINISEYSLRARAVPSGLAKHAFLRKTAIYLVIQLFMCVNTYTTSNSFANGLRMCCYCC